MPRIIINLTRADNRDLEIDIFTEQGRGGDQKLEEFTLHLENFLREVILGLLDREIPDWNE